MADILECPERECAIAVALWSYQLLTTLDKSVLQFRGAQFLGIVEQSFCQIRAKLFELRNIADLVGASRLLEHLLSINLSAVKPQKLWHMYAAQLRDLASETIAFLIQSCRFDVSPALVEFMSALKTLFSPLYTNWTEFLATHKSSLSFVGPRMDITSVHFVLMPLQAAAIYMPLICGTTAAGRKTYVEESCVAYHHRIQRPHLDQVGHELTHNDDHFIHNVCGTEQTHAYQSLKLMQLALSAPLLQTDVACEFVLEPFSQIYSKCMSDANELFTRHCPDAELPEFSTCPMQQISDLVRFVECSFARLALDVHRVPNICMITALFGMLRKCANAFLDALTIFCTKFYTHFTYTGPRCDIKSVEIFITQLPDSCQRFPIMCGRTLSGEIAVLQLDQLACDFA